MRKAASQLQHVLGPNKRFGISLRMRQEVVVLRFLICTVRTKRNNTIVVSLSSTHILQREEVAEC
jgi:hypothetical protein